MQDIHSKAAAIRLIVFDVDGVLTDGRLYFMPGVPRELEAMVTGQSKALPRDVALFQLGEIYAGEGQTDRARQYFEQLVEEFPESPYLATARQLSASSQNQALAAILFVMARFASRKQGGGPK